MVWETIDKTIYITFDDHAPMRYYRGISRLWEIKLGQEPVPTRERNTGRLIKKLKPFWLRRHIRKLQGFNPRSRFFQ